jgi:hypothetical protein
MRAQSPCSPRPLAGTTKGCICTPPAILARASDDKRKCNIAGRRLPPEKMKSVCLIQGAQSANACVVMYDFN